MGRIKSFDDLGCLVTGASSGIGREIALLLADRHARICVTARRGDRLQALLPILLERGAKTAHAIEADLSVPQGAEHVLLKAHESLGDIDVLINNAGFSVPGRFDRANLKRTLKMIDLNVTASVVLARNLLPGMLERNRGGILNVSSVAGFQAAPYQSGYGGTKAFLLGWSNSVHQELKHTDVAMTALCPGVTDTEFFDAAGYRNLSGLLNMRMPADRVARVGVKALMRGRMEVVPGLTNKLLVFTQRFVPRTWAAAIARRILASR